jgi:hypothetical protein
MSANIASALSISIIKNKKGGTEILKIKSRKRGRGKEGKREKG